MTLYDVLMLYNFRANSKDTSKLDDNTQIIRIYSDYKTQHWIEFGVYDYWDKPKIESIKTFLDEKVLQREVAEIRQNYDVDVLEVYLREKDENDDEVKEDEQDIETQEPKEENKKIKKITLVFENCETCDLKVDMFERLTIYGITQDITINSLYKSVERNYSCDDLILEINEKGLKQNTDCYDNDYQSLEDRLKTCKDITAVDITYTDNTKQSIYVLWNNEDEYENKYQTITQWAENFITVRIGKKDE